MRGELVRAQPRARATRRSPPATSSSASPTLELLAPSEPLPFQLDEESVDETLRIHHRYLDLRRPEMQRIQRIRVDVTRIMRRYLEERGFWELETPMLTRSTPEGARDFLVPARLAARQLLRPAAEPAALQAAADVAGYDRYYQIARCFRDEAQRADRQLEFTQLDLEMSFVEREEVLELSRGCTPRSGARSRASSRAAVPAALLRTRRCAATAPTSPTCATASRSATSARPCRAPSSASSARPSRRAASCAPSPCPARLGDAQGHRRAAGVREGVGRQGPRTPDRRARRRAALADREVPVRGRGRRDPRGDRRRARLGRSSSPPTPRRSSAACSARCARISPSAST